MDETKALQIITALANGVNPLTGETFGDDSPYQQADVVRALLLAARTLDPSSQAKPRARVSLPSNAGKPWTQEEDQRLQTAFDQGRSLADLSQQHGRTQAGIEARLTKFGLAHPQASGAPLPSTTRWRRSGSGSSRDTADRS